MDTSSWRWRGMPVYLEFFLLPHHGEVLGRGKFPLQRPWWIYRTWKGREQEAGWSNEDTGKGLTTKCGKVEIKVEGGQRCQVILGQCAKLWVESGGCAIVITTGKKSSSCLSGGCAIIITTGKKKVLVICLAGARLLLFLPQVRFTRNHPIFKNSSCLSGGCAIVITTGKKKF